MRKTKEKLDLFTDINVINGKKGIREGIYHAIHRYAEANSSHMKYYDKNKESSYLKYWDVNNLYSWVMSQKLPVNDFKSVEDISELTEDLIKSYNNNGSNEEYFLEVDVQHLEDLHSLHNDLACLSERMEIENLEELVANLTKKEEYVIHTRNLKQALNPGLMLEKVQKGIKFNQKTWLKSYINMNADLRKKTKNDFEKDFPELMNNTVFRKNIENVTKYRFVKPATIEARRNYLVSELTSHTINSFSEILLVMEMKKSNTFD